MLLAVLYAVIITPMVTFIVLYLREWPHMRRSVESYQLLFFIGLLLLIAINGAGASVFGVDREISRIISRVLSFLAGLNLWYFTYALLRYQVIPRHRRNKLAKRVRKYKAEEDRLSGQG